MDGDGAFAKNKMNKMHKIHGEHHLHGLYAGLRAAFCALQLRDTSGGNVPDVRTFG